MSAFCALHVKVDGWDLFKKEGRTLLGPPLIHIAYLCGGITAEVGLSGRADLFDESIHAFAQRFTLLSQNV